MTQAYNGDITATTTAQDIVATVAGMASVLAYVQNKGINTIQVAYTSVNSAPTAGYVNVKVGDTITGTAAHIWVKSLNDSSLLAVGVS